MVVGFNAGLYAYELAGVVDFLDSGVVGYLHITGIQRDPVCQQLGTRVEVDPYESLSSATGYARAELSQFSNGFLPLIRN
jgi:hypothetical protein